MNECLKKGTKYFNIAGTELKPVVDEKKIKEYNVIDSEIEDLISKFSIKIKDRPTAKNKKRKEYEMSGKKIIEALGRKGYQIEYATLDKMLNKKCEGIGSLALVSPETVKEIRGEMLKKSPNPQPDGSYI